jgi:hypothetical protein
VTVAFLALLATLTISVTFIDLFNLWVITMIRSTLNNLSFNYHMYYFISVYNIDTFVFINVYILLYCIWLVLFWFSAVKQTPKRPYGNYQAVLVDEDFGFHSVNQCIYKLVPEYSHRRSLSHMSILRAADYTNGHKKSLLK